MATSIDQMVPTGDPGVRVALDAAWQDAGQQILRGVAHALGNRVMTIATLAQLVRDAGGDARAGDALASEAERLDALLRNLRVLSAHDGGREEPLDLEEIAREAAELLRRHADVHGIAWRVERRGAALPAWGDRALATRMVAVLLVAGARHALRLGHREGVVEHAGDGTHRVLAVCVGASDGADDTAEAQGRAAGALAPALCCRETARGARYEVRFATLAEARRLGW